MYKDKDKQREAVRLAVQKSRKGITSQGITSRVQESNKMFKDEQDIMYFKVDGQRFYPGRNGYHPEECKCGIEHKNRPPEGGLD